jgi:hypothetical protein
MYKTNQLIQIHQTPGSQQIDANDKTMRMGNQATIKAVCPQTKGYMTPHGSRNRNAHDTWRRNDHKSKGFK